MSNLSVLFKNIISLYGFTIAKLVFPMLVLPYLTRVLSLEAYGLVAYVKTIMSYMQLFVDFGFMLSGTKDVVDVCQRGKEQGLRIEGNKELNQVVGDIMLARIINGFVALVILLGLTFAIPVLDSNKLFVVFSFANIFASIFLFDYVFRGLEQMQVITYRFMTMKTITVALTFVVVHGDGDIMWIPALDLIGSLVAVILVLLKLREYGIMPRFTTLINAWQKLKESALYFVSLAASSLFGGLNTILIGIFLPMSQVAYWSLTMQILSVIQSLYNPIRDAIYPRMVATKSKKLLLKMFGIFMPIVIVGGVFTYFVSDYAIVLIAGEKYLPSAELLRWVIPWILFGFPAIMFGWPALGALGHLKAITTTTVASAAFQVIGLIGLGISGNFSLLAIAILRDVTEFLFALSRILLCIKVRRDFNE